MGAFGPSACISSALTLTAFLSDPASGKIAESEKN